MHSPGPVWLPDPAEKVIQGEFSFEAQFDAKDQDRMDDSGDTGVDDGDTFPGYTIGWLDISDLVDKNGKILYEKKEEPNETTEMEEFTLELNIRTNGKTFDCWLSDDIGGSGISFKKSNKKEFIEALSAYFESYL